MNRRQEFLRQHGYSSLYDYEKARAGGAQLAPFPVLFVVVDEFSELLSSKPEFMDLFVQIGRLGRSPRRAPAAGLAAPGRGPHPPRRGPPVLPDRAAHLLRHGVPQRHRRGQRLRAAVRARPRLPQDRHHQPGAVQGGLRVRPVPGLPGQLAGRAVQGGRRGRAVRADARPDPPSRGRRAGQDHRGGPAGVGRRRRGQLDGRPDRPPRRPGPAGPPGVAAAAVRVAEPGPAAARHRAGPGARHGRAGPPGHPVAAGAAGHRRPPVRAAARAAGGRPVRRRRPHRTGRRAAVAASPRCCGR